LDVRKDIAELDDTEKENFVNALLELKHKPSQTQPPSFLASRFPQPQNRYDDYVMMHMLAFGPLQDLSMIAHGSPTFLPWHRAYLRYLERELQRLKPEFKDVTIPYWDWTSEKSSKAMWDKDFIGGDGRESDWRVMDGKFAYESGDWTLYTAPVANPVYKKPDLRRKFHYYKVDEVDQSEFVKLPNTDNVNEALKVNPYDRPDWNSKAQPSFRNILEGGYGDAQIHNMVHVWVGGMVIKNNNIIDCGTMSFGGSPNDPCFWLHHANIDRLWADWQLNQDHWKLEHKGYQPVSGGPTNLNANDPMLPWYPNFSITPASVANFYVIDSNGYKYKKYFRDTTIDREEEMRGLEIADKEMTGTVEDRVLKVNFESIKDSIDTLIQTLGKPVYPININNR